MISQKWRLAFAVVLFACWLTYLAFLAATARRPIVLSRPQFLNSTIDIIANVREKDGRANPTVEVEQVLWIQPGLHEPKGEVVVLRLDKVADGWEGPGRYILALTRENGELNPALPGRSPGYEGGAPRIYRATPDTEAQYREIRKPAPER